MSNNQNKVYNGKSMRRTYKRIGRSAICNSQQVLFYWLCVLCTRFAVFAHVCGIICLLLWRSNQQNDNAHRSRAYSTLQLFFCCCRRRCCELDTNIKLL